MNRRDFLRATMAGGIVGALPGCAESAESKTRLKPGSGGVLPDKISGMSLEQLRDDLQDRLFNQYLPFWEKGGYDNELGGFMCELNDDGSVFDDRKFIWYQGRGIWVYSYLYNNFGKDRHYLEVARKSRDFMVKYMYTGEGRWNQQLRRNGGILEGVSKSIYGWLFAAAGLIEHYRAAGNQKDLKLAVKSIRAAVKAC